MAILHEFYIYDHLSVKPYFKKIAKNFTNVLVSSDSKLKFYKNS